MARETKVGLIVGLGVILFVSVFVSDYLSVPEPQQSFGDQSQSDFVAQTTNQTQFTRVPDNDDQRSAPGTDPRDLATASLDSLTQGERMPAYNQPRIDDIPPHRPSPGSLAGPIDDATPIATNPINTDTAPIGFNPVHDPRLAQEHQLTPDLRPGPGVDHLTELRHVGLPEPQPISAQPTTVAHTVASGETLTSIARKHYDGDGNLWRSIRDANPGKVGPNGEVVQGVVLNIPKRTTEGDGPAPELVRSATGSDDRPQRQRVRMVTVKEGETLSELAAEHLGSAGKYPLIMAVNTDLLDKPENLRVGMKLRIPAEPVANVIEQANQALAVADETRNVTSERIAQTKPDTAKTYTVKEGDNLYRIAQKLLGNGERYDEIYQANKDKLKSANDIRVGMSLRLPNR